MTDKEIRDLWRKAGGKFHGPNVEHGYMEEAKLLPFLRRLIEDPYGHKADHAAHMRKLDSDAVG
jgi:hypothetical protein